jgi:hypothetical protein
MKVKGWNSFYDGWLAWILMLPFSEEKDDGWKLGWQTADETGESAVSVLRLEIQNGHVIVENDEGGS